MYTNSLGPDRGDNLWLFVAVSIALHALLLLGYSTVTPLWPHVARRGAEPIVVDVVDLPPMPESTSAVKRPPTVFSDRDRSYVRETVPAPSVRAPLPSPPAPAAPASKPSPPSADATARPAAPAPPAAESSAEASSGADMTLGDRPGKGEEAEAASKDAAQKAPAVPAAEAPQSGAAGTSRPSLFPSEERLAELAREYEKSAPAAERGKTLQLNTSELKYQKYLLNMKRRIELRWEYPSFAVQNGWQGILNLDFTINRDGSVAEVRVVKSSGYPVLDEAAATAIRLAAPFPPFPEDFNVDNINIKGRFEYLIYGQPASGP